MFIYLKGITSASPLNMFSWTQGLPQNTLYVPELLHASSGLLQIIRKVHGEGIKVVIYVMEQRTSKMKKTKLSCLKNTGGKNQECVLIVFCLFL